MQAVPVLEFVDVWQQRLTSLQAVGCDYTDATLALKLLGENEGANKNKREILTKHPKEPRL